MKHICDAPYSRMFRQVQYDKMEKCYISSFFLFTKIYKLESFCLRQDKSMQTKDKSRLSKSRNAILRVVVGMIAVCAIFLFVFNATIIKKR